LALIIQAAFDREDEKRRTSAEVRPKRNQLKEDLFKNLQKNLIYIRTNKKC
jgi:hypothetical protein